MILKMFVSYFVFAASMFPVSEGLTGGTKLSPAEIETNIYGITLFQATNGKTCLCVWLNEGYCLNWGNNCGSFDNPADDKNLIIMGQQYKAKAGNPVGLLCGGYTTMEHYISLSPVPVLPPAEIPASPSFAPNFTVASPPAGTECQVVGYSGTYPAPNKIEVKVVDFVECKRIWTEKYAAEASFMKPQRHFCAYVKKLNDPSPIQNLDLVAPIYCKQWWGSENRFWKPFGHGDDDDEDDEKAIPLVFAGFQILTKNPQDVPIVFESNHCPW